MIVSASRRTDIPAFYSDWFMNRVRAGECLVIHPFNPGKPSRVSLRAEDVDLVVFWTRNPAPMLPHLAELDRAGLRYCFLYTLLGYPRRLDPGCPGLEEALEAFGRLSDRIGPERVVWRYDPVVITPITGPDYHARNLARIAEALEGRTTRCIVSVVDLYRKVARRFAEAPELGTPAVSLGDEAVRDVMRAAVGAAAAHGMRVQSCGEEGALAELGVSQGKCVDEEMLLRVFGVKVSGRKDPSQRAACRCVASRDIGAYDTCTYGCRYCYATTDPAKAGANRRRHDPAAPWLLPPPQISG